MNMYEYTLDLVPKSELDEARQVARRLYRKLQDAEDTIIHLQDVIAILQRLDEIAPRDDGLG